MNLNEAVSLLKEIIAICPELEGNDFLIAPSKLIYSNVAGYEIHMTGEFADETRHCINDLAVKKKLSLTMHLDSFMIYEKKPLVTR